MSLNILDTTTSEYDSPHHLLERLQQIPRGDQGWKDYQALGVEIFNYLFVPDLLSQPFKQRYLNADGVLDSLTSKRPDAIYPIYSDEFIDGYWRTLFKYLCASIAVDFKNLNKEPTCAEVEQVRNYLSEDSRRMIGILCSRQAPGKSAKRAQYDTWTRDEKLVLFVTDKDFREMIELRYDNVNPSNMLLRRIQDFFSRL